MGAIEFDREDLDRAVRDGLVTAEQAAALWAALGSRRRRAEAERPASPPDPLRAALALVLGLAASGAAAWALLAAWERFGGAGGFAVAAAYGAVLLAAAARLARRSYGAAGSVLAAAAVATVPIAVHGLQHWLGFSPVDGPPPDALTAWIHGHGFAPAIAAVAAAALALRLFRLPFLSAVLVAAAWFLAMDGAPVAFGPHPTWGQRALLSALFGLVALATAVGVDGRTRRDHARWLYLSGLVAFWGGLTAFHAETGPSIALGLAVNGMLVVASLLLERTSFAIFGAVGIAAVVGHVAELELEDAVVPFAFAAIALALVAGGLAWQRFRAAWSRALLARVPSPLRALLPPAQRSTR